MFHTVTVRGQQASIVWGYLPAATLGAWTVTRQWDEIREMPLGWTLRARLGPTVDRFKLRQRPLLFEATRRDRRSGRWCFQVKTLNVGETVLTAELGPPEQ